MKKLLLALCCLCGSASLFAYVPIPQDTAVVVGTLPNGLMYYIRHNDYIPSRASFHIAQKVGSILELPEQRGLAHFLEHMAFNGTRHFPDNELINYLETIGVKFSQNLNAETGVDQTVYMIEDVPTDRVSTVDSCLLILRDWSDGISLIGKEIDKERGVIEEEWRQRNNPIHRMLEKYAPVIYEGDKYTDCIPIGSMDVVRNCSYDWLRAYYHTWYRPDLQGIIVVGDVDVKATEQAILRIFSDVKLPADATERTYYPVADYEQPRIVQSTDAEMPYSIVCYYQKVTDIADSLKGTVEGLQQALIRNMVVAVLDERLSDLMEEERPPFAGVDVFYTDFLLSRTQKTMEIALSVGNEGVQVALLRILDEMERIRRYGVTQAELAYVKRSFLSQLEQTYNHRNQCDNARYVHDCLQHFLNKEAIPSAEWRYANTPQLVNSITVADLNSWIQSWDTNNTLLWVLAGEETVLPSEDSIQQVLAALPEKPLATYEDVLLPSSLIPDSLQPQPGKIVRKKYLKNGVVTYKLSNGAKVYFKRTDFKEDEVLLSAVSEGGAMQVQPNDWINARLADELAEIGGVGTMNSVQLSKYLSDKQVSLSALIGTYTEGISGRSSVKDVEYLFQLLYAQSRAVRVDSTAFSAFVQRFVAQRKDLDKQPWTTMKDSTEVALYAKHPLFKTIKVEDIEKVDYLHSIAIFKERFGNMSDFDFTIVGNLSETELEPLLEQYIASLPATKQREKVKKTAPVLQVGDRKWRFETPMQVPAAVVCIQNFLPVKEQVNKLAYSMLDEVMKLVYTEKVREEQGGTYGVGTRVTIERYPSCYAEMKIQFTTAVDKVDQLLPIVYAELQSIAEHGPRAEDMQKVKEYAKKLYLEQQKNNAYWLHRLQRMQMLGKDEDADYLKRLEKLSAADVQKAAQQFVNTHNWKELVQVGVEE